MATFNVEGVVAVTTDARGYPWTPTTPRAVLVLDHTAAQPTKALDATLPMTLDRDVLAGDLLVMSMAFDNTGAGTPNVASIDKPGGETNTWTVEEHQSPSTTAGSGVRNAMAWMVTTVPWSASFTPNVVFTESIMAKVAVIRQYRDVGSYLGKGTAQVTTGSPAVTIPGSQVKEGGLIVGSYAGENWGAVTAASDRVAGPWSVQHSQQNVTDASGATTHTRTSQQYKIPLVSGVDVLYNAQRTDDAAAIVLVFDAPAARPMVQFVRNHTGVASSTSSSVMDLGLVGEVPAERLLIVATSYDNLAAGTPPGSPQVVSIAKPGDETADWTFLPFRYSGALSSLGAAAMCQIAYIKTTVPWSASFVPQIVLSAATIGKSAMIQEFLGAEAAHTGLAYMAGPMSTPLNPSLLAADVPVDGMLIGYNALDNTATPTLDTDTDGGWPWSALYTVSGTGTRISEEHKPIAIPHDVSFQITRNAADDGVTTLLSFAPYVPPAAVHQVEGVAAVSTDTAGEVSLSADVSGAVAVVTTASGDATIYVPTGVTHVIENVAWDYSLLAGGG